MPSDAGHLVMLLRHAIAEDPGSRPDEERRLTPEGKRKLREVVAGMRALGLPVEAVLSSPLTRAGETAQMVADVFDVGVEITPALAPGGRAEAVFAALEGRRAAGVVLVGHEPDMGELMSTLLVGSSGLVSVRFKKAGLAGITVASLPPHAAGILEFFLAPAQLRRIGRPD